MIPPVPILNTARLVLRPCSPQSRDDTALVVRTYNDPFIGAWGFARVGIRTHEDVVNKHREHGPRNRPETCTRWMEKFGDVADVVYHLVFLRTAEGKTGDYVGFVGNSFRTGIDLGPDFGYAFFQEFCGQGYATEAGMAAVKWWQQDAGVRELWIATFDDNVASQNCAKRLGFVEGGQTLIKFGQGEDDVIKGRGFILPGMKWPEGGLVIRPSITP